MTDNQKLSTAELLYDRALSMGLKPTWLKPGGLLVITTPHGERYLYEAKSALNSHLSSSLTRNKLNTRLVLQRHGLSNIPFLSTADRGAAEQFLATHGKVVSKPLTGTNSHDVRIVTTATQLPEANLSHYILEKYIAGQELRYLLLDNRVIGVHESRYGDSVAETRYLERISYPASAWDPDLVDQALTIAKALGLRYAAVDYLVDATGRAYVLEVNSSPGMKWFHAPTAGPIVDVAGLFLEAMLRDAGPSLQDHQSKPDHIVMAYT